MDLQTVGDYELVERIAEGGMGAVYRGRHRATGEAVAIKIVPPHLAKNPVLLKRFEQEYNVAKSLDHPNIVRALAFGQHGDSPYLVMEFVEGVSLGDLLEREGRLAEDRAIQIIAQAALGLQKAHKQGLIHRDVKPDNILLTPDGVVKLADLGLVKELEADLNLTRTGRGLGTPHFMAPEQFRNAKNVDARSDVYALAATLYMMVTGQLPFSGQGPVEVFSQKTENRIKPPRALAPALSERADWAIRRAMRAEPSERPGSCREFVEDLMGRATRPLAPEDLGQGVWYVRFKDADGVSHNAQETVLSLRQALKEGLLGDPVNVRASRNQEGPFEPLRKLPEFRDVILKTGPGGGQPTPVPGKASALVRTTPRPPSSGKNRLPSAKETQSGSTGENRRPPAAAVPAPAVPLVAPPGTDPSAPHFELGPSGHVVHWGPVIVFVLFAAAAGAAGFFLLPQLLPLLR